MTESRKMRDRERKRKGGGGGGERRGEGDIDWGREEVGERRSLLRYDTLSGGAIRPSPPSVAAESCDRCPPPPHTHTLILLFTSSHLHSAPPFPLHLHWELI